eukprot:g3378.t1
MTRGAQRDRDRAKKAARSAKKAGGSGSGSAGNIQARNLTDKERLEAKIKKKKELAEQGKLKEKNKGTKYNEKKGTKKMSSLIAEQEFVDAAGCGDFEAVQELLKDPELTSAAINKIDKDHRSAFHYACLNDDAKLCKLLLSDSRVNVTLQNERGETALHMAALYSALEALKLLLADGRCKLSTANRFGETPLHLCAGSGDKASAKTCKLLLDSGASLLAVDQWGRGPMDVSRENAENPLLKVFNAFLDREENLHLRTQVENITKKQKEKAAAKVPVAKEAAQMKAQRVELFNKFDFSKVKLKKTKTVEKTMFAKSEGKVKDSPAAGTTTSGKSKSTSSSTAMKSTGPRKIALSKLIEFPGDVEEVKKHLANIDGVAPGGKDAFGLPALHKFASWNKVELIEMLVPRLTAEEVLATDPEGKTALHWAVEMAAVGAIKVLRRAPANIPCTIKDKKGKTVDDILSAATAEQEKSGVIKRIRQALHPQE